MSDRPVAALLPPNQTPLEAALANTMAPGPDPSAIAALWSADTCPAALLPWLAWALHVDNWDDAATDAQKRAAIVRSIHLHRRKGTPWAVQQALATLGIEVELLDQRAQREIYAALNPNRVNGSWLLDGARQITALERVTGVPQIQHWAQFIVRVNLAELARPELLARMRELIDEWKPARSWPIFAYWLRLYFSITLGAGAQATLEKRIGARYPWCGRVISDRADAGWALGADGAPARLPAAFGSFAVGRRYGENVSWWLNGCRNGGRAAMTSRSAVEMWPRETLPDEGRVRTPDPLKLQRRSRRLDGGWHIGAPLKLGRFALTTGVRLARHPMLMANRLGGFKLYAPSTNAPDLRPARLTLSGRWRLGGRLNAGFRMTTTRIVHV